MTTQTPILHLMPPLQYSVKETARLLGYSVRTVYRLIDAGEFDTTGQRHMLRVTADSIAAYQQRIRNQRRAS